MRPFHIEINWVDYDVTNEDDVYEVIVRDQTKHQIITSWKITASNVGTSINRYMQSHS